MPRIVAGECANCESYFDLSFEENLVSQEPEYCPFCGEIIEEPMEDYIQDDGVFNESGEWD